MGTTGNKESVLGLMSRVVQRKLNKGAPDLEFDH